MKKQTDAHKKHVTVEREGICVNWSANGQTDVRFFHLDANAVVRLIGELQESLLRRSMYDGFMRRSTYDKP
jgi:hypothetical protein